MSSRWALGPVLAAAILAGGGWGAITARGADAAALAREANTALRTAQGAMFNGKLDDAAANLKKAEDLVRELKAANPADAQAPSLEQKCAKLRKDVESRQARAAGSAAPPVPATPPNARPAPAAAAATPAATAPAAAPAGGASGKLPAGASYRLREAGRALSEAERAVGSPTASADWRLQSARAGIETVRKTLQEIREQFGDQAPADHPDLRAVVDRIAALEKQIAGVAAGAAAAQQAGEAAKVASARWEARLSPYVLGPGRQGHDATKWMPASAPRNLEDLARAINVQREAGAVLAEYEKAGLLSPGDMLAEYARQLKYALTSFAASHASFVEESLRGVDEQLAYQDRFVKTQEAKPAGGQEPALTLQKDQLSDSRAKIDLASALVPADDARIKALRARLADIERRDAAIRKARVAHTRVTADRYSGRDLKELKEKAEGIVREAIQGVKVLRATIVSADWKEESVIEPTDTTHTALRFRTTRSVTAQVAAKAGGEVRLHTLDISKDRRADGSWGALYGHVMFTDPMLEENVDK